MLNVPGLNDNFSRFFSPASSAGNLDNGLRHMFLPPKVWTEQSNVCIEYGNQGDIGEMVPFCQHLSTHQDAGLPSADAIKK